MSEKSRPAKAPASKKVTTRVFRTRLREARERVGWSQLDLANAVGLQQSALSHYESGARRPSFTNLRRLATALDVTTDYLVGQARAHDDQGESLAKQIARLRPSDRELVQELVNSLLRKRR